MSLSTDRQDVLRQPCRLCGRLTAEETCVACQQHFQVYGHFPQPVRWQQVPGQPRALARFCGACGRELSPS